MKNATPIEKPGDYHDGDIIGTAGSGTEYVVIYKDTFLGNVSVVPREKFVSLEHKYHPKTLRILNVWDPADFGWMVWGRVAR